ncbi:hypothetical protein QTP88_020326 [Uroleucon formosanum]
MNKSEILQCLDLSDWYEDSSPEGSDDSDEDIIFENDTTEDNNDDNNNLHLESSEFSDEQNTQKEFSEPVWEDIHDEFNSSIKFNPYNEPVGINPDIIDTLTDGDPFDFYKLFLDEEVLNLLVVETNR